MELIGTGNFGKLGRYIGYYDPYATRHEALDKDESIQKETENAARALMLSVQAEQNQKLQSFVPELDDPRPK